MALSPNYSWAEPDNSSLVKNGASDIRTLGDAIDTSVWNVGFGQAGKNKVINGDFSINQRNFTSVTTTATYMFDRFQTTLADGTVTYKFTVGTTGTFSAGTYTGVISYTGLAASTNATPTYKVSTGGDTTSNSDILKSIVALIASINKQIQALQKLILKR